jgi:adenosine deaminase
MTPVLITEEFLREIPKTDLHVHLDGSIRIPTLIELAREQKVELPSYTDEGLRELVFKERYRSLVEYLQGFGYTCAVMQTPEALERIAYEFAVDNYAEGVRYFEVRFGPQLHVNDRMDLPGVLVAVNRGLSRARDEWNGKPAVRSGVEPPYEYGVIASALRMFSKGFGPYYADLLRVHRHAPRKEVFSLASLELARACVFARDEQGIPVTGFDLAGQEAGYPAEDHIPAFDYAHRNFLKKTVHAGEAYGPESIFQAITDLHADRIGHGYYLLSMDQIKDPDIQDHGRYVRALAQYIADRRITLEICLTSNVQTNPHLADVGDHAFRQMHEQRLSMTFCTDNRTVSNTSVTRELKLAVDAFQLGVKDLRNIVVYGFKRSFFPGTYTEKRKYVRRIIDYYEAVDRKHHSGPHGLV